MALALLGFFVAAKEVEGAREKWIRREGKKRKRNREKEKKKKRNKWG